MEASGSFLPVLPSPSASPYQVAVAGRHSMSTAALPFAADFSPWAETAGAARRRMQSREWTAAREEAIGAGGRPLTFPSSSPSLLVLALRPLGVEWSGVLVAFFWGLSLSFMASRNPKPRCFHSFVAGLPALYKWQHGGKGRGMGIEWSGGLVL
jgi:hypothetical protein